MANTTGVWFIGALGGVATTAAVGLAALRRGFVDDTGLVTALPLFDGIPLPDPRDFVVGGHDVRQGSFVHSAKTLSRSAGIFTPELLEACGPELEKWSGHVRPGTVLNAGETIARLADSQGVNGATEVHAVVQRIRDDLKRFQDSNRLEQVVVVNVASTEPPYLPGGCGPASFEEVGDSANRASWPASTLYAWATIDLGWPYVNFTPSTGASIDTLQSLADERHVPVAGKDGKTGETLLKTVLAPMFARRNLEVLSWVGHNIFGNRDGLVLDNPRNKESKIQSKDQAIAQILGYQPRTHVSIEYIESLDDWKTAWDHIHFRGFLGVKMALQFTWQGCDSILAAPLVIDLARLILLARQRGEAGIMRHLACFFKAPMGVQEHDFFKQFAMLQAYADQCRASHAALTK